MRQRKADRRTLSLRALRIRRAVRAYSAFAVALLVIVLPEFWIALYLAALKLSRLLASAAIIFQPVQLSYVRWSSALF